MKVLLIGDIVGKGGRNAVMELVPELKQEYNCSFCIANGENMAGGNGLTAKCASSLLFGGVDVITSGDHIWDQKNFDRDINGLKKVLRPANLNSKQPGKGYDVFRIPISGEIAVINLLGQVFMGTNSDSPFTTVEKIVKEVSRRTKIIFVDFHAEATSEKIAMGRFLDGKVTAVFGTHTHVETADNQVFPNGTAYQTDLGMVGSAESILGRSIDDVLFKFTTGMPHRFNVMEKGIKLCGAVVEFNASTGKAISIERVTRYRN